MDKSYVGGALGTVLIIAIAAAVAYGIYNYSGHQTAVQGTLYVSSVGDGGPFQTLYTYALPTLRAVPQPIEQYADARKTYRASMRSIVTAVDGTIAYLGKGIEGTEVFIQSGDSVTQLTTTPTAKRDLQWAPGGNGFIFSELPVPLGKSADVVSIDDWDIVELSRSGEQVTIGHGIRPHPVGNRNVVALTSSGVVQLSGSNANVMSLISSPAYITDTALGVSKDGAYIAWVASDQTLQVFQQTPEGNYTPLHVLAATTPTSIVFNAAGTHALLTGSTDTNTIVSVLDVAKGTIVKLGTIPTVAEITDWLMPK